MKKFKRILANIMILICLSSIVPLDSVVTTNSSAIVTVQAASYNKATIKKVQEKLNYLGYNCGEPDGVVGNTTKTAIKKYQKNKGLKSTGTVNKSLLKSLKIKANKISTSTKKEITVYVTETGSKYHRAGCRYLWNSKIPMKLSEAKKYYNPCSVCNP